MVRSAYKYDISASYILSGSETAINSSMIKYILIENLYEERYMPVIYFSISVTDDMYNTINDNEKVGKFYLNIRKFNAYSDTSLYKQYIKGQFSYIISTSNPNYAEDLSSSDTESFKIITVALISMDLLNTAKTSFNGIYGDIDQYTMIGKAVEGLDIVIKPPVYNGTFETVIVPALNSKSKLLDFIFQDTPFYDTQYMFFMDFNKAYLLDLTGDYVDAKDGQLDTIKIDVGSVLSDSTYYEGISEENGIYLIHINPAYSNISLNKAIDKVANQMVFVNDTGTVDYVDLDISTNIDANMKQSFQRGNDAVLYKNIAESNMVILEVSKENIDGSIITPNKRFLVNIEKNHDYDGKYTLLYKKEVITNNGGDFGIAIALGLKKVGNITKIGDARSWTSADTNRSVRSKYNTTASSNPIRTNTVTGSSRSASSSTISSAVIAKLPKVNRIVATENSQTLKRKIRRVNGED